MNQDLLSALLAVVDCGNFSQAAQEIHLTQPAISQRIKALELELGSALFERSPGRSNPRLTEIGRLVEREARQSIQRWEKLKREIISRQTLESGELTIGGGATAVTFLLPKVIASILSRYPNLVIRVRESGSAEVINRVLNGEIDVGIITDQNTPLDPRLEKRPLIQDRIVAVVSEGHTLANIEGEISPSRLNGERLVAYEPNSAIGEVISLALNKHHVEAKVWTELRSIHSILEIARLTSSVALVSHLSSPLWMGMKRLSCPRLELDMERSLVVVTNKTVSSTKVSSLLLQEMDYFY